MVSVRTPVAPGNEHDSPTKIHPPSKRRLGFAVKIAGRPDLKDHDGRRWQNAPHLSVSIGYLDRIFDYIEANHLRMYRISSDIAPYVTHPDLPRFHHQIEDCLDELAALGAKSRRLDIRLSMHPSQYIVLNSPNEQVAAASIRDFEYHAAFLDALGLDANAKIITHTGGVYGDRIAAADRFVRRYEALPDPVKRRLVLENDEVSWPVEDIHEIHKRTGIPLIFDNLHHRVNNPSGIPPGEAFRLFLQSWPVDQVPKMHFSSQRLADREIAHRDRQSGVRSVVSAKPKAGQHDEFIDPDEFIAFMDVAGDTRFDIMLEAKQKQLAVFRLREDLAAAGRAELAW